MENVDFTIEITGQASQDDGSTLPLCRIVSSSVISNVGYDFDAYSGESIDVCSLAGQYIASFIFWRDARVHVHIDSLYILMVNLEDKVGIVIYSSAKQFSVKAKQGDEDKVCNKSGIWHFFSVIGNGEAIKVNANNIVS